MTYFADLSQYTYSGAAPSKSVLNVGWLSGDQPISTEKPNEIFVAALRTLVAKPVNLYRGLHICDFCPAPPTIISESGLRMLSAPAGIMGNGEVRVAGTDGITYVAPVLVLHYVVSHRYAPPKAFVDAVIASG